MRKRNPFNLSHWKLSTFSMGQLIPISWIETIPGDTFKHWTQALLRCEQLLAPLMHPVKVRIHHWFCPLRLIWSDFESFITGGDDGNDNTTFPYYELNGSITKSDLLCHLGIPPADYTGSGIQISMLPARALALIYNKFYRDEQLVSEIGFSDGNGADSTTNLSLLNCAWEKDYFTTCRPEQQLGTETVIPLAGDAPVKGIGKMNKVWATGSQTVYEAGETSASSYSKYNQIQGDGASDQQEYYIEGDSNDHPNITADLSAVSGVDIGDLGLALAQQRFKERMNKSGSTYYDYLKSGLGINPQDMRLQLPEYLGGGASPISFSEVLAQDGANTGKMYGHGMSPLRTNTYKSFFHEHGIVMTLMSVIPKSIYGNGIQRGFSRTTKEAYFQHEYEYTADQAVLNKEVYSEHTTPEGTFGYQTRYDEYRTGNMLGGVAGEFCDSDAYHWHMVRLLGSDPSLNSSFVQCNPTTRVYAAPSTDPLKVYARQNLFARRPMRRVPGRKTF
jgi:hypothetical protein